MSRIEHYDQLGLALDACFQRHPVSHWVERLGRNDVPYAPINRIDEVVADPQAQHLGVIVPVESADPATHGSTRAVRPPVQFSGSRSTSVRAAPLLNEPVAAIRAALARGETWPGE
jgi:crotonobetainyl-CoA:carnitine CoA-transferase CaiB-like acyl-CoA transferase